MYLKIKKLPDEVFFLNHFYFPNSSFGFSIYGSPYYIKFYIKCRLGIFSDFRSKYSSISDAADAFAKYFHSLSL